jgi:predicted RNA-binding Zn ribbon-like protein
MDRTALAEQIEPKAAPGRLAQIQALVNTWDADNARDLLADPATARRWLRDAGLIGPRTQVRPADLDEARAVREALRAMLAYNNGGPAPSDRDLRPLRALARAHTLEARIDAAGHPVIEPVGTSLGDGLAGLLAVLHDAQRDRTWERLKACRRAECRWAFFDHSRNHQGAWCEMAVCGNRMKNREFRRRQLG